MKLFRITTWTQSRVRDVAARIATAIAVCVCLLSVVGPSAAQAAASVDINTASVTELTELPGIGPAKAAAIVEERNVAPFKSVDDLARVRGIGDATIADLRDHVLVSPPKSK